MDNRPIGVFDSGLGGLTAVSELMRVLPNEDIVYFGDTGRVPYGGRSTDTIQKYAAQDIRFLRSFSIKAILVACGTASAVLTDAGAAGDIPTVSVIAPAVERAAAATRNGRIGVVATQASIASGAYESALRACGDFEIFSQSCPLFVPLVENGRTRPGDVVIETVAAEYLDGIRAAGCDTLLMGCTHYPLLREVVAAILPGVTLVDAGAAAADALKWLLTRENLLSDSTTRGAIEYHVSDDPSGFSQKASLFLGCEVAASAAKVDIENY